ncbi:MAG: PAS domain S-box protein [Elusimicrobia bacterium]|nr:PAS domain S-box protein [Candidatus Liberimonas magnetica]
MLKNSTFHLIANDSNLRKAVIRLLLFYILLIVLVFLFSQIYFKNVKKILIREGERDLSIIAELKVSQILNWRQERLDDAFILAPFYIDAAKINILARTGDRIKRQKLFCKLTNEIHKNPEYEGIYLYDLSLKLITYGCSSNEKVTLGEYEKGLAQQALKDKKIIFSDLYKHEADKTVDLDVYVPVFETDLKGTDVYGLIVMKISPYKFLYPFMQSNPGPGQTLETFIVRKEGDKALFLNELKYRKDSPLTYTLPMAGKGYPASMAVRGVTGIVEGVDYRQTPVIAAIKKIPESSWILIVKIDKDEVNAPVKNRAVLITLFALIIVGGIGAFLGFIWYRQIVRFYRKQYIAEVERRSLEKKYDYFIKYANDIILIFNKDLRIMEANEKALASYKFSQLEIVQKNLKDIVALEALPVLAEDLKVIENKGSHIFKTIHKRKDGSTFPVEISMQHFVISWNEFYQAIIRDISERR